MTLSWASRVVRGGNAVQTVYWRSSETTPKMVKHGRVLSFGPAKQTVPAPPVVQHRLSSRSANLY